MAFRSAVYARKTLLAGFTTVRDLGGSGVNISLRNAINQGLVVGPRIFTAGKSIGTTGGHADPTNGYREDLMGDPGPREGVINSPDEARQAVRQRYKDGSDLIKITATGGVLSIVKDGSGPQFTDEELKAIVEAARDYRPENMLPKKLKSQVIIIRLWPPKPWPLVRRFRKHLAKPTNAE